MQNKKNKGTSRSNSASNERLLTFNHAINEALHQGMLNDPNVIVMGLGVPDPKGVFGTTIGLKEKFGRNRVFDMPVSENAMTGIAVGTAISGMRPVMTHQRADFIMMAMDQIVNNAAKWHYMYGGQQNVPLTIRTIIGRGWGQGPQHSQNFQGLFAQIPGLKVVAPTTPYEAKGLLIGSIKGNNPVIFIEHRWLSNQLGNVPEEYYSLPLGKANIMREGKDITVIASMDMALEAMVVSKKLERIVSVEVLNLRSIKPLDVELILSSISRTGHALILDSSWYSFGISAEISAIIAEKGFDMLKAKIMRLGLPDAPTPTSPGICKYYYPSEADISRAIGEILGIKLNIEETGAMELVRDVPDEYFKGPF